MNIGTGQANPASHVKKALELYVVLMFWITVASWLIYMIHPTFDRRPLFNKYDQFRDLTNYAGKTEHLWHGATTMGHGFPIYNYPPPGAFVFQFFNHLIPTHPVKTYVFFFSAALVAFATVAWRAAGRTPETRSAAGAAIIVTLVMAEPTWFTVDRGNIEWVVWTLSATGLCFFLAGRNRLAATFIGVGSSIKPFSLLFLLLLIGRRKYKDALIGLAIATGVIAIAAVALGPNPWHTYQALKPGPAYYFTHYVENLRPADEARFEHSLLDGMKIAAVTVKTRGIHPNVAISKIDELCSRPEGWHLARILARVYPWIALVGILILAKVFYRRPVVNQVIAVATAVSLCPPVSGEYTLLQLYVPFGAFLTFLARDVATRRTNFPDRAMAAFSGVFALLFVPLTFLRIYAGTAKLILLLVLIYLAAKVPVPSGYFGDFSPEADS